MLKGLGLDAPPANLLFSNTTERIDLYRNRDRSDLVGMFQESRAEVVIYDPLITLHSANENDNGQMRAVMDALTGISRRTNSTAVVIHHFRKPGEGGVALNPYRMRGAISVRDWADTQCTLTRKSCENRTLRLLEFHKVRNGPEHPPLLLDRNEYFLHQPIDENTLVRTIKVAHLLLELGGIAENQKELRAAICGKTGCSDRTARRLVEQAVVCRNIRQVRTGRTIRYEMVREEDDCGQTS